MNRGRGRIPASVYSLPFPFKGAHPYYGYIIIFYKITIAVLYLIPIMMIVLSIVSELTTTIRVYVGLLRCVGYTHQYTFYHINNC